MTTLMAASNQWSTRPADQRFTSLESLHAYCEAARASAKVSTINTGDLRLLADSGDLRLVGKSAVPATFTHWAFGQLCRSVGAPSDYLRRLPATLAAQNLNHDLAVLSKEDVRGDNQSQLYFHNGTGLRLHAMTTPKYSRIWDRDVTERLINLRDKYPIWEPAPAAFDGSRGLYASDSDMFAFLVDNNRRIFETAPGGGLSRGFFVWNSEVGKSSFGFMSFLYEYCCGNHRVWGASNIEEIRVRHVGNSNERAFSELAVELRKYSESSAADDELKIERARTYVLGKSKAELLDYVFNKRIPGLSRGQIDAGYDRAVTSEDLYGNPLSVWGFTGGLTEVARDLPHADSRVSLEQAAGRVMQIAF